MHRAIVSYSDRSAQHDPGPSRPGTIRPGLIGSITYSCRPGPARPTCRGLLSPPLATRRGRGWRRRPRGRRTSCFLEERHAGRRVRGGPPRRRRALPIPSAPARARSYRAGRCGGRPARTAHQRGEERRSGEAEEGARWGRSRGRGDDAGSRPTLLLPRLETIFGAVTERGGSSLGPSPTVVNDNRRGHHSVVPRRRQRDECRTKLPSPTCSGKFCRT